MYEKFLYYYKFRIYTTNNTVECRVKIDDKTTMPFKYEKGVQQGNPLSPLLFNIFINDIFESTDHKDGVTLDNKNQFHALMYADDLILLSTSHNGLQKSLDGLYGYCERWKLQVNMKKTKCMVFAKGANTKDPTFLLNNKPLSFTNTYKYLGVTISKVQCKFTATLEDLSCKANKAMYALLNKLPLKITPVQTWLKIFDTCITPILLYASEVWGAFINRNWTEWEKMCIEKVHTQFLKRLIGVNRATTNAMVRGELGRHSLLEQITTRNLKYLNYIETKEDNCLIKQAAIFEKSRTQSLNLYSISKDYKNRDQNTDFEGMSKKQVNNYIRDSFDDEWRTYLNNYSKADTYKTFKNTVNLESYLTSLTSRKLRVKLSKFRLSDHPLMIEKGRHCKPIIPREQRFCPICPNNVESEKHFLLSCQLFKDNRDLFYETFRMLVPNFENLSMDEKFTYIMSQEDLTMNHILAQTIYDWMEYRQENVDLLNLILNFY